MLEPVYWSTATL